MPKCRGVQSARKARGIPPARRNQRLNLQRVMQHSRPETVVGRSAEWRGGQTKYSAIARETIASGCTRSSMREPWLFIGACGGSPEVPQEQTATVDPQHESAGTTGALLQQHAFSLLRLCSQRASLSRRPGVAQLQTDAHTGCSGISTAVKHISNLDAMSLMRYLSSVASILQVAGHKNLRASSLGSSHNACRSNAELGLERTRSKCIAKPSIEENTEENRARPTPPIRGCFLHGGRLGKPASPTHPTSDRPTCSAWPGTCRDLLSRRLCTFRSRETRLGPSR